MTCNFKKDTKPSNEAKALMISRLLSWENQARLREWVDLAYAAESSVRKIYDSELAADGILPGKCRSIPVNDILRRRRRKK